MDGRGSNLPAAGLFSRGEFSLAGGAVASPFCARDLPEFSFALPPKPASKPLAADPLPWRGDSGPISALCCELPDVVRLDDRNTRVARRKSNIKMMQASGISSHLMSCSA